MYGVTITQPLKDVLDEVRTYEKHHSSNGDDSDEDGGADERVSRGAGAKPKRYGSVPNLFQASGLSLAPQANGKCLSLAPQANGKCLSLASQANDKCLVALFLIYIFFYHFIIPFGKFKPPYLGKTTPAARVALPSPTSSCWIFHVSAFWSFREHAY